MLPSSISIPFTCIVVVILIIIYTITVIEAKAGTPGVYLGGGIVGGIIGGDWGGIGGDTGGSGDMGGGGDVLQCARDAASQIAPLASN